MQTIETSATTSKGDSVQGAETLLCHLVLTRNHDTEVLLLEEDDGYSVPRVEIPRWQRAAPHLVAGVQRLWGIEANCRFGLAVDEIDPESHYFVLDVLNPNDVVANGASWVSVTDIGWADSEPASTRKRFYAAIRQARMYDEAEPLIPFTKAGWFGELTDWVKSQLALSGLRLNGRWMQYNMGPSFSLVRYKTDGPPVWFKAVGEPNLREYEITSRLREWRSEYLPEVFAVHPGWHGWLAFDAEGQHLDEAGEPEFWKTTARSLAAFQIESIAHSESLLAAGCRDMRIAELRNQVESFLDTVAELMAMQPATPPRILDREDLDFMKTRLFPALEELEDLGLPDTLGHSDLNPGNILVNDERAVFIDWVEGHVGHPFLAFEYLLALQRRLRPDLESCQSILREVYCQAWRRICSERQVTRAWELTPLIAPFAFAVSCAGNWQQNPQLSKLVRSLARRMFREAQSLECV